ncbi:MAG: J domain-containing protein [Myxococcales bacterium]|nr:J domain-containing protein [Myxococcales bacterium]
MEQIKILDQLSRDELYSIYQFLLLESRSPAETPRNASKSVMLETLGQVMTPEEAQYCVEFFENYEYYAVPVLKTEMIDALPDDLLQALFAIYLDDDILPEEHTELVEALGQSQFFLKEDARKFYLWYYYFRERIPIEQDNAQEQTVLVSSSDFSSGGYDEAANTQRMPGFSSADLPSFEADEAQDTQRLAGIPANDAHEYAAALAGDDPISYGESLPPDEEAELEETFSASPFSSPHIATEAVRVSPPPPPPEAFQKTSSSQPPPDERVPNVEPPPSEKKEVPASMRTIELDVFDLENYIVEASQKQGTPAEDFKDALKKRARQQAPPPPPESSSQNEDIEELDSEALVEEHEADFRNEETQPLHRPPPPPRRPAPPPKGPQQGPQQTAQGAQPPKGPPPPPRGKGPQRPEAAPQTPPQAPPQAQEPPAPPKPAKPLEGALALTPTHIDAIAMILYRSSLLGATYARPQIRAIRIYFQKILDCSPAQLRRVRDSLKKLQGQDLPLVPPPLDELATLAPLLGYAKRLSLVHSVLFLLGCKTLQTLERYRDFLSDLAVELRIDPADVSLFNLFGIGSEEIQLSFQDCLRVLDVDLDATESDLRKAHRELVRRYHPDQFHSKGPEFVRLAERKMKEANMALEILLYRSDRGV